MNFWDFSSWGFFNLMAVLLGSLLIAQMLKRSFPALEASLRTSSPNLICAYIYELAGAVNKFYHETRILTEADEELKAGYISLIGLAKRILETCISILGFSAPDKM